MPTRIELPNDLKVRQIVFYQENDSDGEQELDVTFEHNGTGTYHRFSTDRWDGDEYGNVEFARLINRIAAHNDGTYDMSAIEMEQAGREMRDRLMGDPEVMAKFMEMVKTERIPPMEEGSVKRAGSNEVPTVPKPVNLPPAQHPTRSGSTTDSAPASEAGDAGSSPARAATSPSDTEKEIGLSTVVVMLAAEGIAKISVKEFMKIVDTVTGMYPGIYMDKTRDNFSDQCRRYPFMKWRGDNLVIRHWLIPIRYAGYAMGHLHVRPGLYETLLSLIHEARDNPDGSVDMGRKEVRECQDAVDEILERYKCKIVTIDGKMTVCLD